jgi:hypothetical protein
MRSTRDRFLQKTLWRSGTVQLVPSWMAGYRREWLGPDIVAALAAAEIGLRLTSVRAPAMARCGVPTSPRRRLGADH